MPLSHAIYPMCTQFSKCSPSHQQAKIKKSHDPMNTGKACNKINIHHRHSDKLKIKGDFLKRKTIHRKVSLILDENLGAQESTARLSVPLCLSSLPPLWSYLMQLCKENAEAAEWEKERKASLHRCHGW